MLQRLLFDTTPADFIKNAPLFRGLQDSEKNSLIKMGRPCFCPRKKILFRQGDPVTHFYLINKGTVRLFHETPDGHEITTDIRSAHDTLGITGIYGVTGIHHSHAEAIDDVVALEFPRDWFQNCAHSAAISQNMLATLTHRITMQKLEAEQRSIMTAAQILACYLQRLCASQKLNPRNFELPYSKSLIATRLGMKLETFSRALAKLREQGIIVKGKNVSIHDLPNVEKNTCAQCSYKESCPAYRSLRETLPALKKCA